MSEAVLPYPVAVQSGGVRAVLSCDGVRVPAVLVQTNASHAHMEVRSEHPLLSTGNPVTVALTTSPPLTLRAMLVRRTLSRRQRHYELDLLGVEGMVDEAWHALFNRRESIRIRPRTGEFADVLLQVDPDAPSSPVYVGEMLDLSETGLQVRLEVGEPVPGPRRLTMRLSLPRAVRPIGMVCQVRWQAEDPRNGHRLGLSFDAASTPHFWRQQQVVLDYVHRRQQQARRRPATPKAALALGLSADALRPVAQNVQFRHKN